MSITQKNRNSTPGQSARSILSPFWRFFGKSEKPLKPQFGCKFLTMEGLEDRTNPSQLLTITETDGSVIANGKSYNPSLSADGNVIAYLSSASNLVPGNGGDYEVYVKNLVTGKTQLASSDANGREANSLTYNPSISADGNFVVFDSAGTNLVPGDTNGSYDIFVKNLKTGAVQLVSTDAKGNQANADSNKATISADGKMVAFNSAAKNLVPDERMQYEGVFVKNLVSGEIQAVDTSSDGSPGNNYSLSPVISANGKFVMFASQATNLIPGDTNDKQDIFVKNLSTGEVQLVSTDAKGIQGNGNSFSGTFSTDGTLVSFSSSSDNLVPGTTNGKSNIFVKNLVTGEIQLVSTDSKGNPGNDSSFSNAISGDGKVVAFSSNATNLVSDDTNGKQDIFVKNLSTGEIRRINVDVNGNQGNNDSDEITISSDGSSIAFRSDASNLAINDKNNTPDIFLSTNKTITSPLSSPLHVGQPHFAIGSDTGGSTATLYNPDGTARFTVTPFPGNTGGVRVVAADFNGDGIGDLATATGPGSAPQLIVYDGVTQKELFNFVPFEADFTGGIFLAGGDINGDSKDDLVITPDMGGGPRVRIFSGSDFSQLADFFGIDDVNFRGGAQAAIGDMSGNGLGDLIVSAGFGGGPRVAIYRGESVLAGAPDRLVPDFFAFEDTLRNGVYVTTGDLDGSGPNELIVGGGPGGGPRVSAFQVSDLAKGNYTRTADFFAGDPNSRDGVRLAVKNLNQVGTPSILTAASGKVNAYTGQGVIGEGNPTTITDFNAPTGFTSGIFVG